MHGGNCDNSGLGIEHWIGSLKTLLLSMAECRIPAAKRPFSQAHEKPY
jgi:hypothetical protein